MTPPALERELQCISWPDPHAVNTIYLGNRDEIVRAVKTGFFLTATAQLTASFESNRSQERNREVSRNKEETHMET